MRFLRANASRFQIDPNRIGAVGGSAGAHLVGLMAAAPNVAELQGSGGNADQSSKLQAAVVMAGPMELATGSIAERSRDGGEHTNTIDFLGHTINDYKSLYELASPYNHFSKNTPPILFMTGELDKPERRRRVDQKAQGAGRLDRAKGLRPRQARLLDAAPLVRANGRRHGYVFPREAVIMNSRNVPLRPAGVGQAIDSASTLKVRKDNRGM